MIDSATLKNLKEEEKATNVDLYTLVKAHHIVSDEELGKIVADIVNYPYVDLTKIEIPNEILEIVPEHIALKQGIITFDLDEGRNVIKIAHHQSI